MQTVPSLITYPLPLDSYPTTSIREQGSQKCPQSSPYVFVDRRVVRDVGLEWRSGLSTRAAEEYQWILFLTCVITRGQLRCGTSKPIVPLHIRTPCFSSCPTSNCVVYWAESDDLSPCRYDTIWPMEMWEEIWSVGVCGMQDC